MRKPDEPPLVPLFPVADFTPHAACPHHGPLPRGTVLCCMVCHKSGVDFRPALKRDTASEPKPEPKPEPVKPKKLTRKERRSLQRRYSDVPEAAEFLARTA